MNSWLRLRALLVGGKRFYFDRLWGMDIDPTAIFLLGARFDMTYPKGVHVGAETDIAFDAAIPTDDTTRKTYRHTRIGGRGFTGARSVIHPIPDIGVRLFGRPQPYAVQHDRTG